MRIGLLIGHQKLTLAVKARKLARAFTRGAHFRRCYPFITQQCVNSKYRADATAFFLYKIQGVSNLLPLEFHLVVDGITDVAIVEILPHLLPELPSFRQRLLK